MRKIVSSVALLALATGCSFYSAGHKGKEVGIGAEFSRGLNLAGVPVEVLSALIEVKCHTPNGGAVVTNLDYVKGHTFDAVTPKLYLSTDYQNCVSQVQEVKIKDNSVDPLGGEKLFVKEVADAASDALLADRKLYFTNTDGERETMTIQPSVLIPAQVVQTVMKYGFGLDVFDKPAVKISSAAITLDMQGISIPNAMIDQLSLTADGEVAASFKQRLDGVTAYASQAALMATDGTGMCDAGLVPAIKWVILGAEDYTAAPVDPSTKKFLKDADLIVAIVAELDGVVDNVLGGSAQHAIDGGNLGIVFSCSGTVNDIARTSSVVHAIELGVN
jgi:hypothetical protein